MEGGRYTLNESSALLLNAAIKSGITSPRELACLMGNAEVETRGFSTMHESMRYRSARAIVAAVASADDRFSLREIEKAVASQDPREVARVMYENRADIGNVKPGDGWRYHGRGYLQYTGRDNYRTFGRKFGVDLEGQPDLAANPEIAASLAIAYWQDRVPSSMREDINGSARIINGGPNGKERRIASANAWAEFITPHLVAQVQEGMAIQAIPAERIVARDQRSAARESLRQGDQGPHVAELQQTLAYLGYRSIDGTPLAADGRFGLGTHAAVEAFQREHGLKIDGIAGSDTRRVLAATQANPFVDASHPQHVLYAQALRAVHMEEDHRRIPHGRHSEHLAGALTAAAANAGLVRIDRVELNTTGTLARVVQVHPMRDEPGLNRSSAPVDTHAALTATPHYAVGTAQPRQPAPTQPDLQPAQPRIARLVP